MCIPGVQKKRAEEGTGGPKTEGTDGFKMPCDAGAQT